jgi:hypothetical protein
MDAEVLHWEIKRLGREADNSTPPSAEVKNEWTHTSAPLACLDGVYRDSSTFLPLQSESP